MKSKLISKTIKQKIEIHNHNFKWKSVQLDQIADVIDPHPSHRAPPEISNGFPFAGIGDIMEDSTLKVEKCRKVGEESIIQQENAYKIDEYSIGFGRVGTVGKVVKLRKKGFRYGLSPTLSIINANENIDKKFLYFFVKSQSFQQQVYQRITGTTRPSIGIKELRKINIILPSMKEQRKIGKILWDIQEKFESLNKQNKNLEKTIQIIFKSWCIDFEGQTQLENSELGKIPRGWKKQTLDDICEIFSGGTPRTSNKKYWNEGIPWLSSGETRNRFIIDTEREISQLGVKNSSTRLAKKFDVVIASAGQGNTRGQVSLCFIDTYVNQSVVVLRSKIDFLYSYFVFCNLKSRYEELRGLSDSHSSRGSLPKNVLVTVKIVVPEKSILKKFNDVVKPMFERIEKNLYELSILTKTLDSLLPKLMSGEIKV